MKNKTVNYGTCTTTGKRAFDDEHDAEKAIGRARAKHERRAGRDGTRRGMRIETRSYYHEECGGFHLTSMSRREHAGLTVGEAWAA